MCEKDAGPKKCEAFQTVAMPRLTVRKVVLCVSCYWKLIIYYELLTPGQTNESDLLLAISKSWKVLMHIHHIVLNSHLQIITCSARYRTLLMI